MQHRLERPVWSARLRITMQCLGLASADKDDARDTLHVQTALAGTGVDLNALRCAAGWASLAGRVTTHS